MRTYLYHESIRESYEKYFDIDIEMVYLNIGKRMYWAWDRQQMDTLGKQIISWLKNEQKKKKHFDLLQRYVDESIQSSNKVMNVNLSKLNDDELINLAYKHYHQIQGLHCYLGVLIDAVDIYPVEYLRNLIIKKLNLDKKEALKIYNELVTPIYLSYIIEEENEFLKLADKVKKGEKVNEDIKILMKKYWWTNIGWENIQLRTKEDFMKTLKNYIDEYENPPENTSTKENLVKLKDRRKELIKKYKLEDIEYLLDAFDFYTKMHERRKEGQVKSIYAMYLIQIEMAKRLNISKEDMEWYSFKEACNFLKGEKFNKENCNLRKKAMLEYIVGKKTIIKFGNEAIQFEKDEFDNSIDDITEIIGTPASFGKAKGIVKICKGAKEATEKVKKGDILVCGMTLPEYVLAMKKAAAIITDEGGITCHAAIISRELGVPCITGTKIAQKVLKDGMKVEVDADNGIVRRI